MIALDAIPGGIKVTTPYDAAFLNEFKAVVPHAARTWQKPCWIIEPQYGMLVASLISKYFQTQVVIPLAVAPVSTEVRTIELRYLGRCKDRGDGSNSAFGTPDGTSWTIVLPESVLRQWFGAEEQRPDEAATLYTVLACPKTASADEIKRAYRRMARQWHPDVCREPDATQQFQAIQHAYSILSDELKRRKYNAGLALEQSTAAAQPYKDFYSFAEYRAPLRCGLLLCEGQARLGRFFVSRIMAWEDVVRNGKTMVSSWDTELEKVRVEWI